MVRINTLAAVPQLPSADMSCAAHEYLGQRRLRQPSCAHRPCSLWPRAPWHTGLGAQAPAACTPTSADATPPGPALVLPSSAPVALEPAPQACRQQAVLAAAPQHRATREGSTATCSAEVESGRLFAAAGAPRVASTILPHPPHPSASPAYAGSSRAGRRRRGRAGGGVPGSRR